MGARVRVWLRVVVAVVAGLPLTAFGFTTTVGGRRIDLDGTLQAREVFEVEDEPASDHTQLLLRVRFAAALTDWLRFDSTTVGIYGGPVSKATRSGTFNFSDTFQELDPSVEFEEAYLDLDLAPFELRLGKQKLAWGKLDRVQPNEIFNPYQFQDPLMQEQEERKIGIPAIAATYAAPARHWLPEETRFTLAWAPIYIPFRFPEQGERWFPPAAQVPDVFRIPAGLVPGEGQPPLPAIEVPLSSGTRNPDPPARRLENSAVNLRLAGFRGGVDFALYFYHGIDTQPAFELLVEAFNPDPQQLQITADTTLQPVFRHVDAWGADAAYIVGPVTMRLEAAFIHGRPFTRDLRLLVIDPSPLSPEILRVLREFQAGATQVAVDVESFVERDTLEWGLGADYVYDGWLLIAQVNQTDVFDNDVDLLINDVETRLLLNLRKSFWQDRVHLQLVAVHAIESDYTLLLPRLTVDITDSLDVRFGYLGISGSRFSLLGQYKENDQGFVRAQYRF
jgi:hypothetical protein